MKLTEQEIANIVNIYCFKDPITKKEFFELKDFVKSNKFCSFDLAKNCALIVKQKLINISYPSGATIQLQKNKNGEILDIYLDKVGLMFTLKEISKNIKNKVTKTNLDNLANYLKLCEKNFYPVQRCLCRLEYTEITKELRSRIKQYLYHETKEELSQQIALIYHSILSHYYNIKGEDVKSELNKLKTGKYKVSYLDYITAKELKDLTEIQKKVIYALEYTEDDIMQVIINEAYKRRMNFFTNYAHVYPENYTAHFNKPAKLMKDFDKLLEEYNLDIISLRNNNIKTL